MENVFSASYSDKFTPQPVPVVLTLLNDRIKVEFAGEKPSPQEWFYGPIKTKRKTKKFFVITQKNLLAPKLTIPNPMSFITAIRHVAPYATFTNPLPWYQTENGLFGMAAVKGGTIILAIVLVIFALPSIIDKIVDRIPRQTEVSMGKRIFPLIVNDNDEKIDTTETRLMNAFFHQLSPPGSMPVHITVVDSHIENAISLPGGEVIVYSKILTNLQTYPELVALLGHESGHVQYRHSLKGLCRQGAIPIILFTLIGNTNSAMDYVFSHASTLESLSFSRKFEAKADRFGYDWMIKNNVNPQGMLDLFTQLHKDVGDGLNVQFLSNHPLLQNRIDDVKKWIKHNKKHDYTYDPQLQDYWQQIQQALPTDTDKE